MVYRVIGLMSGSSLDGLDIVYTLLDESRGSWSFDILHTACLPYTEELVKKLKMAPQLDGLSLMRLHAEYGRWVGEQVKTFIDQKSLAHQVHFIASHGHTIFHKPQEGFSFQLGDGSHIAAVTGLPVISDLRSLDIALGGQGAPIVPIGDKLLFKNFNVWINLGGIVNMTVNGVSGWQAFDICTGNQMLNALAKKLGKDFDYEGFIAREGRILPDVLEQLLAHPYYAQKPPKSLDNTTAVELVFPALMESEHEVKDLLRTGVAYIAKRIAQDVAPYVADLHKEQETVQALLTGGGALNNFLAEEIIEECGKVGLKVIAPYEEVAQYKEALVMALIGALRWREQMNILPEATGAVRGSVGGALWMGLSAEAE